MVNYIAEKTSEVGERLDVLVAEQADVLGLDPLKLQQVVDETVKRGSLLVVAYPGPWRGYAAIYRAGARDVRGTMHVLEGQPVDVYRSLFSRTMLEAWSLAGKNPSIKIALAGGATESRLLEFGGEFGLTSDLVRTVEVEDENEEFVAERARAGAPSIEVPEDDEEGGSASVEEVSEGIGSEEAPVPSGSVSGELIAPGDPLDPNVCVDCGRVFKTRQALGSHRRSHR